MKHLTYQYGCLDRMVRVFLWSPTCSRFGGVPVSDRTLSKPDCKVAAPTQCVVVLRPVGHLVLWLGELVAAALAVFVGHLLLLKVDSTRIMPVGRSGGQFPIYSTTPLQGRVADKVFSSEIAATRPQPFAIRNHHLPVIGLSARFV